MNKLRLLAAGLALAMGGFAHGATSTTSATTSPAPDPAVDPAGAWRHFLATADFETAYSNYDVVEQVTKEDGDVDAEQCRVHAAGLAAAEQGVPVSVLIRRTAMRCAEALHDDAAAERELKVLASLARHALANANTSRKARPIPIVRNDDAFALIEAAGLETRYAFFPEHAPDRYLPMVVAAWDPERKVERFLRFDFVDVAARIMRDPEMQYPFSRNALIQGLTNDVTEGPIGDLAAVRAAFTPGPVDARLAALRAAAAAGGIESLRLWLNTCESEQAPARCADGLADALLPFAEQEYALPMTLLAYVYGEGVGVKRDADTARRLLAAADVRWDQRGASVEYANLWQALHNGKALPSDLRKQVEASEAAGNSDAGFVLFRDHYVRDPEALFKPMPQRYVDLLSSPAQNGMGEGLALLAMTASLRDKQGGEEWTRKAAAAGYPDAQWERGYALWRGDGVPKDEAAGQALILEAAHAGHARSARHMAYRAIDRGDWNAAESWLLGAAQSDDIDAILMVASMYENARPGVSEKPERGAQIYRHLVELGNQEARVRLASMLVAGRGVPKDVAAARALLLEGAEKGEARAQARFAMDLLKGNYGSVDEREGTKWAKRALEKDADEIAGGYGHWLYYTKATPSARAEALDVWQRGIDDDDDLSANNLAWVLCTSRFDDELDPKAGLVAIAVLGTDSDDLEPGELDTAAACQAANHEFDKAKNLQALAMKANLRERAQDVAKQLDASVLAGRDDDQKAFADRLALYAAGKVYREPPPAQ